jgi:hypothetical protein
MQAIKRYLAAALALPLLVAAPACEKDSKKEEEPPKVEKQELSTLFTGDKVTLPGPFGGLQLGMTEDEGKAALPNMSDGDIKSDEYPDVWFEADFDDQTKKLTRVYFNLPNSEAAKLMTAQWGQPQQATENDKQVLWWFNPEAKLRASISESFTEGESHVEFTSYWPLVEFLGEGPALAFQKDAPLLGLTAAEVESKYGPWVKKKADRVELEYPPLEWGKYWTPVYFMWTDDGKIKRVWFGIDFEPNPAAKDEIMALLKKKWGEPKEEEELGDKVFVFSEEPFIKVEEDTITKKWDIFIEPKRE